MNKRRKNDESVRVRKTGADWDDLAWSTLRNMGFSGNSPGRPEDQEAILRHALRGAHMLTALYVNPCFIVTADKPTGNFLREARRAQRAWLWEMKTVLKRGSLRREMKLASPLMRQLVYTGVLMFNGRHIHPSQWPEVSAPQGPERDLVGQKYGRLTVVKHVAKGRSQCVCECGNKHEVRTKHLVRSKIKSCGCLKAEVDARRAMRKDIRRMLHN